VAAVILIAVPLVGLGPPKRPALPYRAVRLARRLRVVSSSFLERARLRYGSPDYRAASPVMRGVLAKAVEETRSGVYLRLAERVCAPLTLVWGDADTEVPYSVALAFAERVGPRCSIEVARGAGHFPHIAQPEVLKRVTLAALGAGRV
jgi:pimeloyl-ACP methyl ester carboxylesterase